MSTATAVSSPMTATVHRIEIHRRPEAGDPAADALRRDAAGLPDAMIPSSVACAAVYLLEGPLSDTELLQIAEELLADPVMQSPVIGAAAAEPNQVVIEVHPLPGVMDPAAASIATAIAALVGEDRASGIVVRTGRRYTFGGIDADAGRELATRLLANPVIHAIHTEPYQPDSFPVGHHHPFEVRDVPLRDLDAPALERLSREAHLFLSLDEMLAIQSHYRALGREPREIELETLAQTWSEHCVHKTLKATIDYHEPENLSDRGAVSIRESAADRPGHSVGADGGVRIDNLLKSTVAAATHRLMAEGLDDWCLSVFVDNAGIVGFDDDTAVCMKVETHNHPSAIEPYGGAATGIGGCIRDIMGTGLAAKPIAATDVFCVGTDSPPAEIPHGLPAPAPHPRRGGREGSATTATAWAYPPSTGGSGSTIATSATRSSTCGCVGVMPREPPSRATPVPGDRIIAMGGRTGRDGIHGATFSSAELTDTHADEFSHAVQIGNAITEKVTLDAVLAARDHRRRLPVHRDHRLRGGRLHQRRGRDGREDRRRRPVGPGAAQVRRTDSGRGLDQRGPGTHGARGPRRKSLRDRVHLREPWRRMVRPRYFRHARSRVDSSME